jgi:hypothetical protein
MFLKAYNIKFVLSVHALMVLTVFCSSLMKKLNSKFKLAPFKLLTNFEIPFSNTVFPLLFQDPSSIFAKVSFYFIKTWKVSIIYELHACPPTAASREY